MERKQSIVYGAVLLTCVNLFGQVLGFAYRVWLARLIGPVSIGLYQLVMSFYSVMMSLCVSGLTVSVSRMTASYSALHNQRAVRQVVRYALLGSVLLITGFSAALIPISDFVSVSLLGDARTQMGLLLLLPCMLLTGWENVHKNYFYGSKNVIPPAVSEVLEQITRATAILGLLVILSPRSEELQVGIIVIGMIISEVFSATLLTIWYRRRASRLPLTGEPIDSLSKKILAIAGPVALANVSTNLIGSINTIIIPGRLIVSGMDATEAMSAYGVAFGMTMPLLSLPMVFVVAISLVTLPRLSEAVALRARASIHKYIRVSLTLTAVSTMVPSVFLVFFGRGLAVTLFQNPNAGSFLTELVIATVFTSFEYVLSSLLNAMGKQKNAAGNLIAAGCVQLVLTWFLVSRPELRLLGFVYAYMIGNLLGGLLNLRDVKLTVREFDNLALSA